MSFLANLKFHISGLSQNDLTQPGKTQVTLIPLTPLPPTPAPVTPAKVNSVIVRPGQVKGAYPGYQAGAPLNFSVANADAAGLVVGAEYVLAPATAPVLAAK